LTRDLGGAPAGALLDEFEEIAAFPVPEWSEPPVVEDEKIGLGQRLHELSVGAIRPRVHEVLAQEAGQSDVAHGVALATRTLAPRIR
jgi:hypothetical protein